MARIGLTVVLVLALFAGTSLLAPAPSSFAEIDGPCTGTVAGQDVGGLDSSEPDDAIEVEKDDVLDVTLESTSGAVFTSHKIDLEIAGLTFNIEDDPEDSDPTVVETVNVDDYATFGVGFYKVSGSATLQDGSTCSGAVLIQIKGNPLTTIGGIAAIIAGAIGVFLLGFSGLRTLRQFRTLRQRIESWGADQLARVNAGEALTQDELVSSLRAIAKPPSVIQLWMLALMPAMLLMGASMPGGMPAAVSSVLRLPRIPFRPKLSFLSSIGGMLLGETVVTFLNFLAIQPLTGSNAILGAALGIVLGVTFDSVVKWFGTRDVNKTVARLEKQLAEARDRQQRSAGGQVPPSAPPSAPQPPETTPPAQAPPDA
jgi:hypothetical protein